MTVDTVVLLVEDNPDDVTFVYRAFKKVALPSAVQTAENGEVAIAYLKGDGRYQDRSQYPFPALILLDLKMPRLSGHDVLRWIRQQPQLRRIPVIVWTSSARRQDIDEAYDNGASAYILKPVMLNDYVGVAEAIKLFWLNLNQPPIIPSKRTTDGPIISAN